MPSSLPAGTRDAVRTEHPVFVGWIAFVSQLHIQLFFTLWAGGFCGGVIHAVTGIEGRGPFVLCALLAFLGIPCVTVIGKRLNYERTAYLFFDDRIEFEEGFFSRNRKVIAYRDIREVSLRMGVLQRTCGLGTIYLGTLATGASAGSNAFTLGFGNVTASGISVKDVRDPEATFRGIRSLVEAGKAGRAALAP